MPLFGGRSTGEGEGQRATRIMGRDERPSKLTETAALGCFTMGQVWHWQKGKRISCKEIKSLLGYLETNYCFHTGVLLTPKNLVCWMSFSYFLNYHQELTFIWMKSFSKLMPAAMGSGVYV